jgi:hypothetical protein
MKYFPFIFGIGLFYMVQLYGSELSAPTYFETAQVLPSGIGSPHFSNLFTSIDSKFGGAGSIEPLGVLLNRTIRWSDIIEAQATSVEKSIIQSTLRDANINLNGSPGSTLGQINAYVNAKVPTLAYGITDRFTMAVAVPVMSVSVSAATGFYKSDHGQSWVNSLCTMSIEQCNKAAGQLNNAINERLISFGYQPLKSKSFSSIGDIQLIGKYLVYQDKKNLWGLKSTVVLPTGIAPNPDIALDIPTGDGQYKVGLSFIYDRVVSDYLRWNTSFGYLASLPHQIEKRIPNTWDDPISKDKEQLTQNLGSATQFGTSLQFQVPKIGLISGLGYNFQYQARTTYSGGSRFSQERYEFLENWSPSELLHSATIMTGFSTIEWVLKREFFYPLQAYIVYSRPILGRNVTNNGIISGELTLFF